MTTVIQVNAVAEKEDPNLPEESYSNVSGVGGDVLPEILPKFNKLPNEKVISKNDSYIVLGKDRTSHNLSGHGNKAKAKSSAIDIVVGRISCVVDKVEKRETLWVNPDFKNDAARIHISQKTDIDKNFDLPDGVVGISKSKSGIGLKADSIRIIARSGIKLVTSIDQINSSQLNDPEKVGIDLIAGRPYDPLDEQSNSAFQAIKYRDDMQPIPKGINLKDSLEDIAVQLDSISGVLATFVNMQMEFNNYVTIHTHIENFYGLPGIPSKDLPGPNIGMNFDIFEKTMKDITNFKMQYLPFFRKTYLDPESPRYINSRYHNLN
jgi:hypothetical protein